MAHDTQRDELKSFKDTLNLTRTDFPIRGNAKVEDPALLERWAAEGLDKKTFNLHAGAPKYILHDGPPYANGDIHLGHAYNKILKDILCKAYRMAGYHVPVTPGWDCHGLPIEIKVTQAQANLTRLELMKACRLYATHWIEVQRASFKTLGVLFDWDNPYITMDPLYEAATVRAFGVLVEQNFIERKNKTVPWCFSCRTVLASAEIEHKDRKDPSIYVLFDLVQSDQKRLFPDIEQTVSVLVWTTTPWTLPLNRAVAVKPGAEYQVIAIGDKLVIVGAQVADNISQLLGVEKQVVKELTAQDLCGVHVKQPLGERTSPLIFDDSVGLTEGTAFVHIAPGAGPIDYEIGVKNNLEIYSPVTDDGLYSTAIEPAELVNMPITEGQIWVIKKLAHTHKMLFKNSITHSYPHCWRCSNGLIFRATPQWFFDLDRHNVKNRALEAINTITFIPARGRNFLKATVEHRWEWCLSRQRTWGSPIPALLCNSCDYAYCTPELIEKVASGIAHEGIEYWAHVSISDLIPNLECPSCHGSDFRKETDILDVWFDAGISHYAVLYKNPALQFPADIYLEGIDQHRGWFQSSLLTSLVLEQEPCMKTIMTHGYTVDAKGQKMSKSLGNVVAPQDIINQVGTDGLRLWVASVGHDTDPSVSDTLLRNIAEVHRKIRNTCRFLLSNLYDYHHESDKLSVDQLLPIDKYALGQLCVLNDQLVKYYLDADFTAVFHALAEYCTTELSSFYLDISKDRLYVEKANGVPRRSAQTVYWYILDTITRLMAPILSFTAEHVSDFYQKDKKQSIHLQTFADTIELYEQLFPEVPLWQYAPLHQRIPIADSVDAFEQKQRHYLYQLQWQLLKEIRSAILKAIELEREKGLIKHSLEAQVELYISTSNKRYTLIKELFESLNAQNIRIAEFLKELLIVSQVTLHDNAEHLAFTTLEDVYVKVSPAQGTKCPRCWQWDTKTDADGLCVRCQRVLYS